MIYYVIIAILAIILVLLMVANYFFNLTINTEKGRSSVLSAGHNQIEESDIKKKLVYEGDIWYEKVNKEDVFISSKDNLKLHGNIVINNNKTNEWVIICHGYFGNINQLISGAKTFYELGYNLLLIDSRTCGLSDGKYVGLGTKEKYDIIEWIKYLNSRYSDTKIILFGISMGAATVMMCSSEEMPNNVKAIIEDCGYTSVLEEFSYQVKILYRMPSFPIVNLLSIITKIRAGYWLKEANPIEQVKKSRLPILFIHGDSDTFVPPFMVDKLYEVANCKKEKLIIKDAGHGASYWMNSKKYWKTIKNFIDENI